MSDELFTRHGIDFKLGQSGKHWQLRYRTHGRWESLSIWSTRSEAMDAADVFSEFWTCQILVLSSGFHATASKSLKDTNARPVHDPAPRPRFGLRPGAGVLE